MSNRGKLIELAKQGLISWEDLARLMVNWASEDDCEELLDTPDLEDIVELI